MGTAVYLIIEPRGSGEFPEPSRKGGAGRTGFLSGGIVTDEDLMIKAVSGDKAAFGELVRRNMRKAYLTALRRTGSRDDALDLSQEAFIRAYRKRHRFSKEMLFFPWYYRILVNLCKNHLRNRSRRLAAGNRFAADGVLKETKTPEEEFACREEQQRVWDALGRISEEKREIIMLREFEEMSYREIAQALDIPEGTVMSRLYSARKDLLNELLDMA